MRILHLADLHLDRPFRGVELDEARSRRRELRHALSRCLEMAAERRVDFITIGGDLWEDEHVVADTRNFVADQLGKAAVPVLLVCGNHDPYLPGGNYARTDWPDNVHVFEPGVLGERRFDGLSVHGISWGGGALSADFLDRAGPFDDGRQHVLLLHATAQEVEWFAKDVAHCPFDPARVKAAGFSICLAGHIHAASAEGGVVYPGSPEPLGWDEAGRHCVAILDWIDGVLEVELVDVNRRTYETRSLDCEGAASSAEVADRLAVLVGGGRPELSLRVELTGQTAPECEIDTAALLDAHSARFAHLELRDLTAPGYDLDERASRRTADGTFVRMLRERIDAEPEGREREVLILALQAGLRSLDRGREVLRVD